MKHLISTLFFIVCGIFCTQLAFCDTIPIKGEWSEQDFRSVVPAPPTASIEGNVLTVNFVNPLADLTGFVGFRCRLGCFLLYGDRPAAAGRIRCIARRFLHALPVVHIAVKPLAVEAVIVVFHMPCLPFML